MRQQCVCGSWEGNIIEKGAQDTVWCDGCNNWVYNAPRRETGKSTRHVKNRDGVKPSRRIEVLLRAKCKCEICGIGSHESPLHAGHLISRRNGRLQGWTEDQLDSIDNLAAMCDACNLGLGAENIPGDVIALIKSKWTKPLPVEDVDIDFGFMDELD